MLHQPASIRPRPTQLLDFEILHSQLHTTVAGDRIYATWVAREGDITQVYVARGPFGCGMFEGEGDE